jgi:hypothetical protein
MTTLSPHPVGRTSVGESSVWALLFAMFIRTVLYMVHDA